VLLCRSSAPVPFESELYGEEEDEKRRGERWGELMLLSAERREGDEGLGNSSTRLGREKVERSGGREASPQYFTRCSLSCPSACLWSFAATSFGLSIPTSGLGLVRLLFGR